MYNREKEINEVFSDLKEKLYKLFNLSSNIDIVSKKIIEKTIIDKKIVDIIYKEPIDFFGKQFLEFLKKYNIETGRFTDTTD